MPRFHVSNLPQVFEDGSPMTARALVDLGRFAGHPTDTFERIPGEFSDEGDLRQTGAVDGSDSPDTINGQMVASCMLPASYVAGSDITLEIIAALTATVNTSAHIDATVYKKAPGGKRTGSDLCETDQQDCNSTTFTTYSFTIDGSGLVAGDKLLITIKMSLNDTGSAVSGDKFGQLTSVALNMHARGGMIL